MIDTTSIVVLASVDYIVEQIELGDTSEFDREFLGSYLASKLGAAQRKIDMLESIQDSAAARCSTCGAGVWITDFYAKSVLVDDAMSCPHCGDFMLAGGAP